MTSGSETTSSRRISRWLKKGTHKLFDGFLWLLIGVFALWACGAIWFLYYLPSFVRTPTAGALGILGIAYIIHSYRKQTLVRCRAWIGLASVLIYLMTLGLQPSNDRQWDPDQAKVARVKIESGQVAIENFRHAQYRSDVDYDVQFFTKSFPLERIQGVWFLVQRFTSSDALAHLFLSFELAPTEGPEGDGKPEYFSLSVEIRRELGESYGPIKGLYRSYELTHIIGDERDLIGVRTVHRPNDRVYLYRLNATSKQAQSLFVAFADRIDSLHKHPEFYHTLLSNCANGITRQTYGLTPEPINWLDPRIVLPGYSAEFAFEKNLIGDHANGQTFERLQTISRIDKIAREVGITDSFSHDIRRNMAIESKQQTSTDHR